MGDVEDDLRSQFTDALEGAEYPVSSPMDLLPALPEGPGTTFEAGDVSITAMELSTKLGDAQEFPYDDVEEIVDDVIQGMKDHGML